MVIIIYLSICCYDIPLHYVFDVKIFELYYQIFTFGFDIGRYLRCKLSPFTIIWYLSFLSFKEIIEANEDDLDVIDTHDWVDELLERFLFVNWDFFLSLASENSLKISQYVVKNVRFWQANNTQW